ncbi:YkgJ family cysteine cluster protein [Pseudomonas sp. 148P]|uniref:YkgJ family cysteine cluster protein n=1 Tax=Pseudomonas ulcerans TaxID=3115852 RepID=A0ABU7HN71_9PSED|nr:MULTISPECIES: YkgJ family cysteine cluster protein [unclassified Pseudomonas]MEE1922479.1 YkgJ family cysteine cluster protein [Pseudomonas sp. 147P]MEE1932953.1 YkgJ family cysteine cluster protein [Pseudomonas sp. 148P]
MSCSITSPFPCNQCGLCCQHVHMAEETRFLDRGDGTCRHYDAASKRCRIYEERPDICRVDLQFTQRYARQFSWDEYVRLNMEICDYLQQQHAAVAIPLVAVD